MNNFIPRIFPNGGTPQTLIPYYSRIISGISNSTFSPTASVTAGIAIFLSPGNDHHVVACFPPDQNQLCTTDKETPRSAAASSLVRTASCFKFRLRRAYPEFSNARHDVFVAFIAPFSLRGFRSDGNKSLREYLPLNNFRDQTLKTKSQPRTACHI
jgi:hypothetical protein